jgi:hypothetical protein
MDKENGNRKRSTKGKVGTERVQMGRSRGKKRKEKWKSDEKATRKGRRRSMHGKKSSHRQ